MIGQRRRGGRLLSLVALLALFGMALHGPLQVAAQDVTGDTGELEFKDIEGFQRGAGRVWMGDITSLFGGMDALATPGAEIATPDINSLGLFMLTGMVAEFDNDDHASSAVGQLADDVTKSLTEEDSGVTVKEVDSENLGDQTKAYAGSLSEDGMDAQLTLILVQKGNFIYAGIGMGFGSDPTDATTSLLKDMTGNKPSDGDGTFNEDGTSTGGLWDVFPSNDADYLKGLTPMSDEDLSQSGE